MNTNLKNKILHVFAFQALKYMEKLWFEAKPDSFTTCLLWSL